jgi:hypothetical protein
LGIFYVWRQAMVSFTSERNDPQTYHLENEGTLMSAAHKTVALRRYLEAGKIAMRSPRKDPTQRLLPIGTATVPDAKDSLFG